MLGKGTILKVLLVGAGAVGQVFGRHLAAGGAEVAFLVKAKHVASCREGFMFYGLNRSRRIRWTPESWSASRVYDDVEAIGDGGWDQVWLCMSSTGLRGAWLERLCHVVGDATIVTLQPGLDDRHYLLEHVPEERLVSGMISFLSYVGSLPDQDLVERANVYWFPPFARSPFSGPELPVRELVEVLERGGLPARRVPDVTAMTGYPTAILMPHLVALECSGWRFRALRRSRLLYDAARATREASAIVSAVQGSRMPVVQRLVRPLTIRTLLRVASWLLPFDLESYLELHFTTVGDQTRMAMSTYLSQAHEHDLSCEALSRLMGELGLENH